MLQINDQSKIFLAKITKDTNQSPCTKFLTTNRRIRL